MELLVKVGNKTTPDNVNFNKLWRDGQIVDAGVNGSFKGYMMKRHFCVIKTHHDFWTVRGSRNLKSASPNVLKAKEALVPTDRIGKYPWDFGFLKDEKAIRKRDWFIDFKYLLDMGWITLADFESIYDKTRNHNDIYIDRPLSTYIFNEKVSNRRVSKFSNNLGTISAGTFGIGTGIGDAYPTITAFEADIALQLTGNLTGEHSNEETAITSPVTFDIDNQGFNFTLTAKAGAEHNGGAYGNGARIAFGTWDILYFDESVNNTFTNLELSKLQFSIAGSGNYINCNDLASGGTVKINRLVLKGDGNSNWGVLLQSSSPTYTITNNVIYGFTKATAGQGAGIRISSSSLAGSFLNNTFAKNKSGLLMFASTGSSAVTVKNNIGQGNITDFSDAGAGFGTTGVNISEDATSPDVAYRNLNLHDATSNFIDYTNNDYRLIAGGSELTTIDDGEDLSATFTDDIIGTTRSTWYAGAHELVIAGGGGNEGAAMYHHLQTLGVY